MFLHLLTRYFFPGIDINLVKQPAENVDLSGVQTGASQNTPKAAQDMIRILWIQVTNIDQRLTHMPVQRFKFRISSQLLLFFS